MAMAKGINVCLQVTKILIPTFIYFQQNSNPSLTPSASPSISRGRKDGPAPPPPPGGGPNRPPTVGRPPHPAAKPPPPPLPPSQNKGGMVCNFLPETCLILFSYLNLFCFVQLFSFILCYVIQGSVGNPAMRAKSFNHGGSNGNRHTLEHRSSKDDIQVGIMVAILLYSLVCR